MIVAPPSLQKNDTIALISPAGIIAPSRLFGAAWTLNSWGFKALASPHALGRNGIYSGNVSQRLKDLEECIKSPEIKAILCSRGGYGCVQLMSFLTPGLIKENPKWLIGFSDVSALHGFWAHAGVMSIHGPMARHLSQTLGHDEDSIGLLEILKGQHPTFKFSGHNLNCPGTVVAPLYGGNLSVLSALISTPFDLLAREAIIFLEDINEPVYKIERVFYQLKLSGRLDKFQGLVVGQFTGCDSQESAYQAIHAIMSPFSIPVCFDAPLGHGHKNIPLVQGANYTLAVGKKDVILKMN